MDKHSRTSGLVVNGSQQSDAVCVNDTFWGYVIRPSKKKIELAAYGEMAASFSGVLLGMAAYGQWLLPGSIVNSQVFPFKLTITVVFAMLACFVYLIARRGLCYELQVDLQRQVVRTARRNRHGSSTQIGELPFQDIDSVFIKRSQAPMAQDKLFIRPAGNQPLIEVATGRTKYLDPILTRMSSDLTSRSARREIQVERPRSGVKPVRARSAFATN